MLHNTNRTDRVPLLCNAADTSLRIQVVKDQLFNEKSFRGPTYGRSNVPFNSNFDHPGIWENASQAYLHEVLIRKKGIAATLAIIFAQVRALPIISIHASVRGAITRRSSHL